MLTKHTCNLAEKVTSARRETWKHLKETCDKVIKHACHGMSRGRKLWNDSTALVNDAKLCAVNAETKIVKIAKIPVIARTAVCEVTLVIAKTAVR